MSDGVIGIDVGKHAVGVSLFVDKKLERCGLARARGEVDGPLRWRELSNSVRAIVGRIPLQTIAVIEGQRIYRDAQKKGDQNDIIDVAYVTGYLAATILALDGVELIEAPRVWKGTLDGDVFIETRIQPEIKKNPNELNVALASMPSAVSLAHNVWDAIGIGLWKLGRLTPRKVYPR